MECLKTTLCLRPHDPGRYLYYYVIVDINSVLSAHRTWWPTWRLHWIQLYAGDLGPDAEAAVRLNLRDPDSIPGDHTSVPYELWLWRDRYWVNSLVGWPTVEILPLMKQL